MLDQPTSLSMNWVMCGKWQGSDILKLRLARGFTSDICALDRWVGTYDEKVFGRSNIAMARPSRNEQDISCINVHYMAIWPAQH